MLIPGVLVTDLPRGVPARAVILHRPRPERDDVVEAPAGRDVLGSELVDGIDVPRLAGAQDGSGNAEIGVLPAGHGLAGGEVSPGLLAGVLFGIGDAAGLQGVVIGVNDEDPDIARQRKPRHQAVLFIQWRVTLEFRRPHGLDQVVVRQRQTGRDPAEAHAQGACLHRTVRPIPGRRAGKGGEVAFAAAVHPGTRRNGLGAVVSCTSADTTWPPSRVASVIVLWKKTSTPDRLAMTSRQRLTASGSCKAATPRKRTRSTTPPMARSSASSCSAMP